MQEQEDFLTRLASSSVKLSDKKALILLDSKLGVVTQLSFQELWSKALAISSALKKNKLQKKCVVLLYDNGLEFLPAFLGCIMARVIAIPIKSPDVAYFAKDLKFIQSIMVDSKAKTVLVNGAVEVVLKKEKEGRAFLAGQMTINTSVIPKPRSNASVPSCDPNAICYLQYTSGSTSDPKGVIVTCKNIVQSVHSTSIAWNYNEDSITVNWAPHTHVYGLVCGLLTPLFNGNTICIISAKDVITNPLIWLQCISNYRATHSGCPNFGYDLCANRTLPSATKLDLGCWKVAVNGGDLVLLRTLQRFSDKFTSYGFSRDCFYPAYGMSEFTGLISSKMYSQNINVLNKDKSLVSFSDNINFGETLPLGVSCGFPAVGVELLVVNPDTLQVVNEGEEGEIWITGNALSSGYWNKEPETKDIMQATLPSLDNSPHYLRTGDLGTIKNGELFITGRIKELIILHGKKYSPLDIELVAVNVLKGDPLPNAAFSIKVAEEEKAILVQEYPEDNVAEDELKQQCSILWNEVFTKVGIAIHEIILTKKGNLPKTSSGKVQRLRCLQSYLNNQLPFVYKYTHQINNNFVDGAPQGAVEDKIRQVCAEVLNSSKDKIGIESSFFKLGGDSISITAFIGQINDYYGLTLSPAILFEYITLRSFAQYLLTKHSAEVQLRHLADASAHDVAKGKTAEAVSQTVPIPTVSLYGDDIAVIGMSGIFPGAVNLDVFWNNLVMGKDAITEIPKSRWSWQQYYGDVSDNKTRVKWGGFIEGIDQFDATFFNISPHEAELMDPQQRLFLEVAWKAVEDAGYSIDELPNAGLFVGVSNHDYNELLNKQNNTSAYSTTGLSHSILANRISYLFNWSGPSEAIDTACSGSLVAIHNAIKAIHSGDCDVAIAGGVNAILTPTLYISSNKAGMICEDGRCKTFDKAANGYVRAEGAGAVLLKPLKKAIADRDIIYGIIKGSAVNHGGHVSSLTVPNPNAQAALITAAIKRSRIDASSISYIEMHGTGTPLGDPIEVNGLKKAFRILQDEPTAQADGNTYCGLGSVKTNIGHLESAAGIAGVIKVLLSMKHKQLPAILHFRELNPYIELQDSPFYIVDKTRDWAQLKNSAGIDIPRRAGISSFGFGGMNAHIVLEEAPDRPGAVTHQAKLYYLIAISAKTEEALKQKIANLEEWVGKNAKDNMVSLANISYTLNVGRKHFKARCAIVVSSIDELQETLQQINESQPNNCLFSTNKEESNFEPTSDPLLAKILEDIVSYQSSDSAEYYKELLSLGDLYIKGSNINWKLLYSNESNQRISLPTYPFSKKRYWYNSFDEDATNLSNQSSIKINFGGDGLVHSAENIVKLDQATLDAVSVAMDEKGVALIKIEDKAQKNQLTEGLLDVLTTHIEQISSNPQAKVIVITGYDDIFCLGGSQDGLEKIISGRSEFTNMSSTYNCMLKCSLPVITAMQGHAFGGGLAFGLYADIIVMSEDHLYSANFMHYGFTPGLGATLIIKEKLSERIATEMIWSAQEFIGKTLKDQGAGVLFQPGHLVLQKALSLADSLAEKSIHALRVYKRSVSQPILDRLPQVIERELAMHSEIFADQESSTRVQNHFIKLKNFNSSNALPVHDNSRKDVTETEDVTNVVEKANLGLASSSSGHLTATSSDIDHRTNSNTTTSYTKEIVLDIVTKIVSKTIHVPTKELLLDEKFVNLGIDSIAGVGIIRDIAKTFDLQIQAAKLYDYPTINQLTGYIYELVKEKEAPAQEQAGVMSYYTGKAVLDIIAKIVSKTIHVPTKELLLDEKFVSLGIDSIAGVGIIRDIAKTFNLQIQAAKLYDYPTINQLANYIYDLIKGKEVLVQEQLNTIETGDKVMPTLTLAFPVRQSGVAEVKSLKDSNELIAASSYVPIVQNPKTAHLATDIAIIGISGRFPDAQDVETFWQNLAKGKDSIVEIPLDRWSVAGFYEVEKGKANRSYSKWGGFLDDIDKFDPLFFNISPLEARQMDPQQRLFLEESWKALEDAGYSKRQLSGKNCGVFVGAATGDYQYTQVNENRLSAHSLIGNAISILTARISYFLDLIGPTMAIDTACSSSLVAVHEACQSIRHGECDMALSGGVYIMTTPNMHIMTSQAGMLSSEGKCKTFDKDADGFVPGEGVGVIVLKRLDKALADGDQVYGVIKGSKINQDGSTNGITAPSSRSQEQLAKQLYENFDINPADIGFVETHGTGTKLGDPIEINALNNVFNHYTTKKHYCALGSVKTNIGHTLPAAGIAGVIKALLCLQHKQLVPSLHFNEPNEHIDYANSPFYVNREIKKWEQIDGKPLLAAISSFGFSGTNAHIVIEEAPNSSTNSIQQMRPYYLITLSAKTKEVLKQKIVDLEKWAGKKNNNNDKTLANISYTLNVGRTHFEYRCSFVVSSIEELIGKLRQMRNLDTKLTEYFYGEISNLINSIDMNVYKEAFETSIGKLKILNNKYHTQDYGSDQMVYKSTLEDLANLYVKYPDLDLEQLYDDNESKRRISLPTYPFAKHRYWHSDSKSKLSLPEQFINKNNHPTYKEREMKPITLKSISPQTVDQNFPEIIGRLEAVNKKYSLFLFNLDECSENSIKLSVNITPETNVCLRDHKIYNEYIMPTDAYIEMVYLACQVLFGKQEIELREMQLIKPLIVAAETSCPIQLTIKKNDSYYQFAIFSKLSPIDTNRQLHAKGQIILVQHFPDKIIKRIPSIQGGVAIPVETIYSKARLGNFYQTIQAITYTDEGALVELALASGKGAYGSFITSPSIIDGSAVSAVFIAGIFAKEEKNVFLPIHIESFAIYKPLDEERYSAYLTILDKNPKENMFNIELYDTHHRMVAKMSGLKVRLYPPHQNAALPTDGDTTILIDSNKSVEEVVKKALSETLLIDIGDINEKKSFQEIGLDSILGVEFIKRIKQLVVLELDTTILYSHSTTEKLVAHLSHQLSVIRPNAPSSIHQNEQSTLQNRHAVPSGFHNNNLKHESSISAISSAKINNVVDVDKNIREIVRKALSETLLIDIGNINEKKNFQEIGLDSILGVEFIKRIKQSVPLELDTTILYSHSTIEKLTTYLSHQLSIIQPDLTSNIHQTDQVIMQDKHTISAASHNKNIQNDSCLSASAIHAVKPKEKAIAIIGMSGRFPDANNLEEFWRNLASGVDSVREIPRNRWSADEYYDSDQQALNKTYSRVGAFVKDVECFEPLFFNISPKEAEVMDPQQRLFLEEAWKALEDAGYSDNHLSNLRCGVFVGAAMGDYIDLLRAAGLDNTSYAFTGLSTAILASRISYFLNLKGSSLAIDTACSSSLVAVHQACESILSGENEIALAGGVYLMFTPQLHIKGAKIGTLSPTGPCKAFDQRADGIALGEGVGVLVLKPLSQAIADKNTIYGVIKGSGVNQDGATNGITAPNPEAQIALMLSIYEKARIDPERISYVETHGTGTPLGDPIELSALTQAFRQHTDKIGYCAVGSVKTNIGHTVMAAGVASVIKVLLALKYKKIPPILNYVALNERIKLKDSPFHINTELTDWKADAGQPRCAAVSSFGFSGTNAHVVIEEAPFEAPNQYVNKPYYLITLSAKTDASLQQKVIDLSAWVTTQEQYVSLEDIIYTLNAGRSHFDKRCAWVVSTIDELKKTLGLIEKGEKFTSYFFGHAKKNLEDEAIYTKVVQITMQELQIGFASDNEKYKKNLEALASLYVKGYDLDWEQLHCMESKHKCSLPTYPFIKERHWVEQSVVMNTASSKLLHPLIDANTSTLEGISFSKLFTGKEHYLTDHRIYGIPVLPGVVHLEMARAAGTLASQNNKVIGLRDVTWMQPISIIEGISKLATVKLYPTEAGATFEVSTKNGIKDSDNKNLESETIIHSQGKLVYNTDLSLQNTVQASVIDIEAIKQRCFNKRVKAEHEARCDAVGIYFGPAFQVDEETYYNDVEALSKLQVPPHLIKEVKQFELDPYALDRSVRAIIELSLPSRGGLGLPFSMSELMIFDTIPEVCYSHIRIVEGIIPKYQIQITNETGRVVVSIKDLVTRVPPQITDQHMDAGVYYYQPLWKKSAILPLAGLPATGPIIVMSNDGKMLEILRQELPKHIILQVKFGESYQNYNNTYVINAEEVNDYIRLLNEVIEKYKLLGTIIYHTIEEPLEVAEQLQRHGYTLLNLSKALIQQKTKGIVQLLCVNEVPDQQSLLGTATAGFIKTLELECQKLSCRVVEVPCITNRIISQLIQELTQTDIEVRYDNSDRWIKTYQETPANEGDVLPIRRHGVYLITGGAGGLGLIFAKYLAENYQAKLFLTGRSELDSKQRKAIANLKKFGTEAVYFKTDITNRKDVKSLLQEVKDKFGELNGIIHSAGIIRDAFITKKVKEEMREVLSPKINGVIYLDELTNYKEFASLDFFILFSSIASVFGNAGQCDYSYANGFMDAFAAKRETLRKHGKRYGRTISINWPGWEKGGMQIDDASKELLKNTLGAAFLTTDAGIKALNFALSCDNMQQIVFSGYKKKLVQKLGAVTKTSIMTKTKSETETSMNKTVLSEKVQAKLMSLVSDLLKIKEEDLDPEEALSSYGLDSISLTVLVNSINKYYKLQLTPIMLFEHPTISSFANYLTDTYDLEIEDQNKKEEPTLPNEANATAALKEDIVLNAPVINNSDLLLRYKEAFFNYEQLDISLLKTSKNITIEVIKAGNGDPIVLLPPAGCLATIWKHQIAKLSKYYEVISLHYPGCGRSDHEFNSVSQIAELVLESLDIMGITVPVHLVGWSLGGCVAQVIAIEYSNKIKAMTLVGTSSKFNKVDNVMEVLQKDFVLNRNLIEKTVSNDSLVIDNFKAINSDEMASQYYKNIIAFDCSNKLHMVNTPTLIISGMNDKIASTKDGSYIHSQIKHSTYHTIKDAGHYIPLFNHKQFNKKLMDFVSVNS